VRSGSRSEQNDPADRFERRTPRAKASGWKGADVRESAHASAQNKSAVKKKGRFGNAKAAKFREETPRKGGGFAGGPAIPRCNNMMELTRSGKS
jgi:hypothetical protein